ncbi:MAG: glycosyl hydrolase [Acidobacteria bacterium]|nr:glycosyl hydrolase [Acidobacteriota bacterium]
MKRTAAALLCLLIASSAALVAKEDDKSDANKMKADTFTGLALRGIGPAQTSGRVADLAVHPRDVSTWYVAVASGGVWKTTNAGTTWTPIFDSQASFSIGCVTLDPKNPLVVWVGSGENNSQRSVAYGDGVYKSIDGGKNWENVGLKTSEHIGRILVDPRDGNVVYVAAQGPLWTSGGERGLYKTTDGGKTWKQSLKISDDTGVNEVVADPRNPDILFASAYQRRRHVFTLIDGGPESAIYKSTDAGATWKKLENGLPKEEMGRIGLAVSPANPDVVYAVIESVNKAGGFYRSVDQGGNWEKMSDYAPNGGQYYNEIFADPKVVGRVYAIDTWLNITEDGGKTFARLGEKYKHVDNHVVWIDPDRTDHLLVGCDGGLYETFDRGARWRYFENLPVTQFYRVAVDDAKPFYNVYGGTQDNQTLGGPSRTRTTHGITNPDWFVTVGGDGFQPQVDPENPDIVYSESQYGGLIRHDRKNGEILDIQPQPGPDGVPLRWNWDSPLIISPHSHTRLYFASQKIFRSDDRGDTWTAVSPDLSRQIDRNKLKIMGRVFSVDSVAKNTSTSFYGNIVSLHESPLKEGLLYAGTDDGLVQVTENGGKEWRKIEKFPGVPENTYVSALRASGARDGTVYAAFDNHQMGDFKPYLLKSTDRGASWTSIAGDLPERGTVYSIAEDHVNPDLLFAGTEFGLYFTIDGGAKWIQLKGGLPTIAVRDIVIQKRENDLVIATFGRGFYILDDYAPLRKITREALDQESMLFPVKPAAMFIPSSPFGLREKSFLGETFFSAPNPPFGAVVTYYLKDEIKTLKKQRQAAEKDAIKKGDAISYPSWEALRAEEREEEPAIIITVTDDQGGVVSRLTGPVTAGFHRVAWDLRYPASNPTNLKPPTTDDPFRETVQGPLASPGTYRVAIAKRVGGKVTPLGDAQVFEAAPIAAGTLSVKDRAAMLAFERKTARLQRAVLGAVDVAEEAHGRLDHLKKALADTPGANPALADDLRALETRLKDLEIKLNGDSTIASHQEPSPPSIVDRIQGVVQGHWTSTAGPTDTHRRGYDIAASQFGEVLDTLRTLVTVDLKGLEDAAEAAGAPWTPGRFPTWKPE